MGHGLNYDRVPRSLVFFSRPFLFRNPLCANISRERRAPMRALLSSRLALSLFLFAARAIAITMRYEVDIVTNVMEPGTIFRARSFEVREEKGQRSSG